MAILEQDEEIRQFAAMINKSEGKPRAIKSAEWAAWLKVRFWRRKFEQTARQLQAAMGQAEKAMEQSRNWEIQHQEFLMEFVRMCEKVKEAQFRKDMQAVARVRRKLGDKFQEQVTREPILRRVMSGSRSRPPTPI